MQILNIHMVKSYLPDAEEKIHLKMNKTVESAHLLI